MRVLLLWSQTWNYSSASRPSQSGLTDLKRSLRWTSTNYHKSHLTEKPVHSISKVSVAQSALQFKTYARYQIKVHLEQVGQIVSTDPSLYTHVPYFRTANQIKCSLTSSWDDSTSNESCISSYIFCSSVFNLLHVHIQSQGCIKGFWKISI